MIVKISLQKENCNFLIDENLLILKTFHYKWQLLLIMVLPSDKLVSVIYFALIMQAWSLHLSKHK